MEDLIFAQYCISSTLENHPLGQSTRTRIYYDPFCVANLITLMNDYLIKKSCCSLGEQVVVGKVPT